MKGRSMAGAGVEGGAGEVEEGAEVGGSNEPPHFKSFDLKT